MAKQTHSARALRGGDGELYTEAYRKIEEKFGADSRACKTMTNGIDIKNVKGSQFFWNNNLKLHLPKGQNVISFEDMKQINDLNESLFEGYLVDVPEIILITDKPLLTKNRSLVKNLAKQVREEGYGFSLNVL